MEKNYSSLRLISRPGRRLGTMFRASMVFGAVAGLMIAAFYAESGQPPPEQLAISLTAAS